MSRRVGLIKNNINQDWLQKMVNINISYFLTKRKENNNENQDSM